MNPLDFHSVSIVKHKHHLEVFEVVKVSKKNSKLCLIMNQDSMEHSEIQILILWGISPWNILRGVAWNFVEPANVTCTHREIGKRLLFLLR